MWPVDIWKKSMLEFESYTQKPDDIKSRYVIYTELLELWEDALVLLNRQYDYSPSKIMMTKIEEMEIAIKMLKTQIDVMCNYKSNDYRTKYEIDHIKKDDGDDLVGV